MQGRPAALAPSLVDACPTPFELVYDVRPSLCRLTAWNLWPWSRWRIRLYACCCIGFWCAVAYRTREMHHPPYQSTPRTRNTHPCTQSCPAPLAPSSHRPQCSGCGLSCGYGRPDELEPARTSFKSGSLGQLGRTDDAAQKTRPRELMGQPRTSRAVGRLVCAWVGVLPVPCIVIIWFNI